MADIAFKIHEGSNYGKADIVQSFTKERILRDHCHRQCFEQVPDVKLGRKLKHMKEDGFQDELSGSDGMLWSFYHTASKFKFERVNKNQVRITQLSDNDTIVFTEGEVFIGFNGKPQAMNSIDTVVRKKRKANQFPVWGTEGAEIWFGGWAFDDTKVQALWDELESKRGLNRDHPDFQIWGTGDYTELKTNLFVQVDDFSELESQTLTEPGYEINSNGDFKWERTLKDDTVETMYGDYRPDSDTISTAEPNNDFRLVTKSKRRVAGYTLEDLADITGTSLTDIEDRTKMLDPRKTKGKVDPNLRDKKDDMARKVRTKKRVKNGDVKIKGPVSF